MSIKRPTAEDVAELAASLHMNMTVEEAGEYLSLMGGMFDAYDVIDELPNPLPPVKYPRMPGAKPMPRTTNTAPGRSRPRSRARRAASSPAAPSC